MFFRLFFLRATSGAARDSDFSGGVRGSGAVGVGKMICLVGEIVVSLDNLGAETANACLSTETKITCSHVFVDEILGTWRARSPPKTAAS